MKRATFTFPIAILLASTPALAQESPEPLPAPPSAPAEPATTTTTTTTNTTTTTVAPPAARAETPDAYAVDERPREPLPDRFRLSAGLRIAYVHTHGFDTFADTNTLPQLSIDGTYAFYNSGRLALAAGLGWDVGGRGSDLRGLDTSLTAHRFLVPLEARVTVLPWLWAFGKVAPGAALVLTDIEDPSAPRSLGSAGWAFAGDVSAGASFVIGKRAPGKHRVRVLLTPEIGYSITTAAPVHASPGRNEDELLGSDADTNLRSVALSGLFWRATLGVTF
jgi:hypothetical protein